MPTREGEGAMLPRDDRPRCFRWRIIPATLSWLVSALLFLCGAFWLWELFLGDFSDDADKQLDFIFISMPVAMLAACLLNFASGRKWMAGQWLFALSMNIASGGTVWHRGDPGELRAPVESE